MTNKEHIENVIDRTFEIIKRVYDNQQEKEGLKGAGDESRIIFPKKRKKEKGGYETRISEQELRFVFVEQLNNEIKGIGDNGKHGEKWNVYYSVETPTEDRYYFKDIPPHRCDETEIQGQSANFDLVIHDSNFRRIALIEFKANNPDIHDYQKDFVKLTNIKENDNCKEEPALRYFIQLLQNTKTGKDEKTDTMLNIEKKKINSNNEVLWKNYWGPEIFLYRCYSLEKGMRAFNKEDVIRKEYANK